MTLDLRDPVLGLNLTGIQLLPLIYGFHFQWGPFEYEVLDTNHIRITELDASSFDKDWPYKNYPAQFSKIPMRLSDFQQSSLEEFEKNVWQGIDPKEADKFICIVPPSARYGVHLWQKDNDRDFISIKFFVDAARRKVTVSNECG